MGTFGFAAAYLFSMALGAFIVMRLLVRWSERSAREKEVEKPPLQQEGEAVACEPSLKIFHVWVITEDGPRVELRSLPSDYSVPAAILLEQEPKPEAPPAKLVVEEEPIEAPAQEESSSTEAEVLRQEAATAESNRPRSLAKRTLEQIKEKAWIAFLEFAEAMEAPFGSQKDYKEVSAWMQETFFTSSQDDWKLIQGIQVCLETEVFEEWLAGQDGLVFYWQDDQKDWFESTKLSDVPVRKQAQVVLWAIVNRTRKLSGWAVPLTKERKAREATAAVVASLAAAEALREKEPQLLAQFAAYEKTDNLGDMKSLRDQVALFRGTSDLNDRISATEERIRAKKTPKAQKPALQKAKPVSLEEAKGEELEAARRLDNQPESNEALEALIAAEDRRRDIEAKIAASQVNKPNRHEGNGRAKAKNGRR